MLVPVLLLRMPSQRERDEKSEKQDKQRRRGNRAEVADMGDGADDTLADFRLQRVALCTRIVVVSNLGGGPKIVAAAKCH